MKHPDVDVVVVGGGHAGAEAADAAARRGARTLLVSQKLDRIGEMSCNPAIGGIGKGHLVREIDALDGLMGRAADAGGIQFRLLNRSKGPAVQGPRTQADRALYRAAVQGRLRGRAGLSLLPGEVVDLILDRGRVCGVMLADGASIGCRAVVLTTGTFLGGIIHIGEDRHRGGRMGDPASTRLADRLRALELPLGRLKTGTPPRLDGRSIDWSRVERQEADAEPVFLSFLTRKAPARQIACGITRTNPATHRVIADNLSRSAMYGGHIAGVGPRYCPSIEDKVVRFPDKDSHQIFLEPEGLETDTVYPNGISTSLPPDVQEAYVQTIPGLERARITQPGYAIEYDYVDPCALSHGLALRAMPGLFLAGQINGTTGYEEAAAQGLVAGLNAAALAMGLEEFRPDRTTSYIGVLIDDLVTRGVTEPYRMFTSRAEFRLSLRADNADQRLTPLGMTLGCVGPERAAVFAAKMGRLASARATASARPLTPGEIGGFGVAVNSDGQRRTALDLLAQGRAGLEDLLRIWPELGTVGPEDLHQIARDALYSQYLERQARDIAALRRDEALQIPPEFDYGIPGLSAELQAKLRRIQPDSIGQAARIEGMTPAAFAVLAAQLRGAARRSA